MRWTDRDTPAPHRLLLNSYRQFRHSTKEVQRKVTPFAANYRIITIPRPRIYPWSRFVKKSIPYHIPAARSGGQWCLLLERYETNAGARASIAIFLGIALIPSKLPATATRLPHPGSRFDNNGDLIHVESRR